MQKNLSDYIGQQSTIEKIGEQNSGERAGNIPNYSTCSSEHFLAVSNEEFIDICSTTDELHDAIIDENQKTCNKSEKTVCNEMEQMIL